MDQWHRRHRISLSSKKIETQDFQETVTLPEEKRRPDKPKTETKTDTKKGSGTVIDQGEVFNPEQA